jgi:hypothetical protein
VGASTTLVPFWPQPAYPDASDASIVGIMSFPIAGSAVAIGYYLTAAACGGSTPPASIQLDSLQVSRLFGGDTATWNDAALVAIQPPGSMPTARERCATAPRGPPARVRALRGAQREQ